MYTKQIWKIWLIIIFVLLFLRITILSGSNEDIRFTIFNLYACLTWLSLILIGFIRGRRLRIYLRTKHPKIYSKFYGRAYGTDVVVDPIVLIKFGFSKEKHGDTELDSLVTENKHFTILILTVFFTLPILFLLMMI
jgi:hypothetical protein